MQRPRQLRQNLFLHFAEPRLWLKIFSSRLGSLIRGQASWLLLCSVQVSMTFLKGSPSAL